ncbi:MAG: Tfp pilus assembly protein FimT/FimU, partial [Christensenellaceae bacterium]
IAVVAILMAVLIPTFVSLVKKANVSSDTQLVRNLNTALKIDGTEHKTMTEALAAAEDSGFDVAKISAKVSENEILWDSVNDCFVYMEEGKSEPTYIPESKKENAEDYQLWQIVDAVPASENQKYSVYLSGTDYTEAVAVSVGFDAGKNTGIPSVSYINSGEAQNVVIRTNGGTLTVNAPNDTVNHYSVINVVEITDIASADCYHEYGTVKGTINLAKGKVVLESGSNTGFVNVTATSANDIAIDIKSNADYGRITAATDTLLTAVKDKVTSVDEVKTLVAAEGTVAIVNNVAYDTIDAAKAAFTGDNAVFELFCDVVNNDMDNTKSINIPANGVFDGHGYQFNGNVAIHINAAGGTVKNVAFFMIANNAAVDEETREYYQMEKARGKLSAIYANNLTGKAVIENCVFDSVDWDAIQITPKAGAVIDIHNNIFKTSNTVVNQQMRFIHVESDVYTDFMISVQNCDFYDVSKLQETALEIYYPKTASKVVFARNYYDGLDTSKTYTNNECKQGGSLLGGHLACVGTGGSSYINACVRVLDEVASRPNN